MSGKEPTEAEVIPFSPNLPANSLVLTVTEAANALRIGRTNLYKLIRTGEIETVTIGDRRLIPHECLTEYVNRLRRVQSTRSAA